MNNLIKFLVLRLYFLNLLLDGNRMIVLGIDPGSVNTGYAFVDVRGSEFSVLEYGALHAPKNRSFEDRLLYIVDALELLMERYQPEMLGMESAFVAVNARSALVLGHVRGAILVACKRRGMSFSEFPPSTIKQAVTGKGNASKELVANMIYARLGIAPEKVLLDATDALAIAWTTANPNPISEVLLLKGASRKSVSRKRRATVNEWKSLIEKMGGKCP